MSDARWYAVWPEPRSRSRSLKGSRPSVPHGTNFIDISMLDVNHLQVAVANLHCCYPYCCCHKDLYVCVHCLQVVEDAFTVDVVLLLHSSEQ